MKRRIAVLASAAAGTLLLIAQTISPAAAQGQDRPQTSQVTGHIQQPGGRAFSPDLLNRLRVPAGFRVSVFAEPKGNARMMWTHTDGTVYLTRQEQGDVMMLRDADGDGRAEMMRTVASGLELVHGMTIFENKMYLVAPTKVWSADVRPDGTLAAPVEIISDLPDGGQHRARQLRVGPDRMLYIAVGSTCNTCDETNKENATLLRASLDGKQRTIFAKGLRHTIGFDFHPETKEMWGMDMGSDWHGDDLPHEELNRITEGADYGWPYCYDAQVPDQFDNDQPKGTTKEAYCRKTVAPALTVTAHSAPIGMTYYTGAQFPAEYRGDAFVALRGSWNRRQPSGYKVVRVEFEGGKPMRIEDFMTGFLLSEQEHFARVAGVTIAKDGALLVSDDANGVIYRVAYAGGTGGVRARR